VPDWRPPARSRATRAPHAAEDHHLRPDGPTGIAGPSGKTQAVSAHAVIQRRRRYSGSHAAVKTALRFFTHDTLFYAHRVHEVLLNDRGRLRHTGSDQRVLETRSFSLAQRCFPFQASVARGCNDTARPRTCLTRPGLASRASPPIDAAGRGMACEPMTMTRLWPDGARCANTIIVTVG
jgi:hypothetical protein